MTNRRRVGSARPLALGVAAVIVPALLTVFALATFARDSFAASSPAAPAPTATPVPLPPNPALDAHLTNYIQKRFMISDPGHIQLGPAVASPIKGLSARSLKVSNDRGQSVSATIYVTSDGNQMILSQIPIQIYDLKKDPWEKIDMKSIHLEDRPVMGSASAPVEIVEFADFECPYCARAFGTLETMAHTNYKDKIKVLYKNYPLNSHPWAVRAALGAECARLQNPDAFWDFARDYYTNQGQITVQNIDDHIHGTAKRLNLDTATLDACMNGKAAKERIEQDQKDGNTVGVQSTPTLFVNGVRVVGLPEEKAFDWVVTQQLNESAAGKEMLRN
jgi:protein-disulfide isomerase